MLLNRLSNFSFLPSLPSGSPSAPVAGVVNGNAGAQPGVDLEGANMAGKRVGSAQAIEAAAEKTSALAQDSVLLHLDSSSKAASAGVYTRAGLIPDLASSLPKTPLTPAEEFVAAAVINLRNYDQAKINGASDAASKSASNTNSAYAGRLDSIKQAMSKLYASA